jgi:hypothetical protein
MKTISDVCGIRARINILIDHDNDNYCLSEIRSHFDGYIEGKQRKKEIAA